MDVLAPNFGTLAIQHVDEGAEVEKGEDLGEIEAMKTYTRFYAPCAGRVTWLVELGEVVGEGDAVAEVK